MIETGRGPFAVYAACTTKGTTVANARIDIFEVEASGDATPRNRRVRKTKFVRTSADLARLGATLVRMGFQVTLGPNIDGDVHIRFSNSHDFGRFLAEALTLLSGDEVIRIGSGCLATLSRQTVTLICDRAE